jgi:hypothetical protein
MRNVSAMALATIALAACGLVASAPVSAHPDATGCRVFADVPNAPAHQAAHPQLFAWAEVHCSSKTSVSVRVCAMNIGVGGQAAAPKPVWCVQSRLTAPAGHRAFVKTLAHNCTVGSQYVSFVSLNGLATDRGPWAVCHSIP